MADDELVDDTLFDVQVVLTLRRLMLTGWGMTTQQNVVYNLYTL